MFTLLLELPGLLSGGKDAGEKEPSAVHKSISSLCEATGGETMHTTTWVGAVEAIISMSVRQWKFSALNCFLAAEIECMKYQSAVGENLTIIFIFTLYYATMAPSVREPVERAREHVTVFSEQTANPT